MKKDYTQWVKSLADLLNVKDRPSEKAILSSRLTDRPIRPLFPEGFRNDVQVLNLVMSVDQDCAPEIAAMIGTSAALSISDVPFNGPIGGVAVGRINGEFIINPDVLSRQSAIFMWLLPEPKMPS
jgi:polyribonucleotide nucleotidyltransferase